MNTFSDFFSKLHVFRKTEEDDTVVRKFIKQVRPHTMLSEARLISLYTQVKYCEQNHIKGDYMECGVWKGGAVGLMALTNQLWGAKRRHLHLFDSFEDIIPPDVKLDGKQAMRDAVKYSGKSYEQIIKANNSKPLTGFYDGMGGKGSVEESKKLLLTHIGYDKRYVHVYKGWFEYTMPKYSKGVKRLAILRIDADWYKSVSVCLNYFYPKVVNGGFIIVDDYGYYEGCTKAVNDYFSSHHIHARPNRIEAGCEYFIKAT